MVVLLLQAGCHGGVPTESPRSVAEAVVAALDQGDAQRLLDVLPSEDKLGEAFDCGRADSLRAALRRRKDDARAELEALKQAQFRTRLVAFDASGCESSELAPGDVFQGCTAKVRLGICRARVSLSLRRGGRNDETKESWTFLRFDPGGPWYYAKF